MSGRLGQGLFSDAELGAVLAPLLGFRNLGLAVSGGPDSLGLMVIAARWARRQAGLRLVVYTLDHRLRPEAADEAAMVAHEAGRLGLSCAVLRWNGDKPATGIQAAAREARYRLIGAAMREDGVEALVTAHHVEDQAETVLMRLAHGSGIAGLGGMEADTEVEGVRVLRPLLGVPRERLAAEVAAAGLTPATDPGNLDTDYERVRWRQALPVLADLGLSPERLALFARRADEANRTILGLAMQAAAESLSGLGEGPVRLSRRRFEEMWPAVRVRLLALLVEAVGGRAPQLAQVETLHAELTADAPFTGRTLAGAVIRRTDETIAIAREPLTGARARVIGALTQGAAGAGQTGAEAAHIAEIAQPTAQAAPLYPPGPGPTFAQPSQRAASAGIPGQD